MSLTLPSGTGDGARAVLGALGELREILRGVHLPLDVDIPSLDSSEDGEDGSTRKSKGKGKGKQRASPLRMRTAPASFLRSPSPAVGAAVVPLRRARTAGITPAIWA